MQSRLGSTQLLFLVRPSLACSTRVNRFLDLDCRDPHVDFPHSSPRSVRSAVCCLEDFSWSHLDLALGTGETSRIICCRSTCSIICTRLVKRTWKGHEKNKERTCKEHGADMRRAWRGPGVAMENIWKGRGEDVATLSSIREDEQQYVVDSCRKTACGLHRRGVTGRPRPRCRN